MNPVHVTDTHCSPGWWHGYEEYLIIRFADVCHIYVGYVTIGSPHLSAVLTYVTAYRPYVYLTHFVMP